MDSFFDLFSSDIGQAPEVEDGGLIYEVDGESYRVGGVVGGMSSYYTSSELSDFIEIDESEITPAGVWDESGDAHPNDEWNCEDRGDADWI